MKSATEAHQTGSNTLLSLEMGQLARAARKAKGMSIRTAAAQLECSPRFILQLEQGKPTARMDKVLQTLSGLGLELRVHAQEADDDTAQRRSLSPARTEARAKQTLYEKKLAGAHLRIAALLALDAIGLEDVERARSQVRKWADAQICSQWYIDRWTGILAGSGRQIAAEILGLDDAEAQALFQNTPFGFLVREHLRR